MPVITPGMTKFRKKVQLSQDAERLKEILELKDRLQHDLEYLIAHNKIKDYPDYMSLFGDFGTIDYSKENLIGKGSFTKSYVTNNPATGEKRAIKVINMEKSRKEYAEKFLPRQLNILIFLSEHPHPNIIKVNAIGKVVQHVFIDTEYCSMGTLRNYRSKIKTNKEFNEDQTRNWLRQLISAIEFLHYYCIAHRNITPENVFIMTNESIRLSGFGFSRFCYDIETGTFRNSSSNRDPDPFLAPEIIEGETTDPKMGDIWSWGAIFYYLVTGDPPFNPTQYISKGIKLSSFTFGPYHSQRVSTNLSERVSRLLADCLTSDPAKRATLHHVKAHPWLKEGEPLPVAT